MTGILPAPEEYAALTPTEGSPVWRAFSDVRMLSTAGYATLLQVAYPTVGYGVHQYSSFVKDPWGRLFRTLDYVHGTIYGGPELAGSIGARVRAMHKTIRGRKDDGSRYSAMEPDAFAWVHATLAVGIFEGTRHFSRPMSAEAKQEFWTGSLSDLEKTRVQVSEETLRKYVGYYEGYWRANLRKVTMSLKDGKLHATGLLVKDAVPLIPESDTVFTSEEGVSYKFVMDESGKVIRTEEIHRGGNYILNRK